MVRSFNHRRGPVAVAVCRALGVGQDPVLPVGHPGVHSCRQVASIYYRYLGCIPGYPGSAHPYPQLTTPARV